MNSGGKKYDIQRRAKAVNSAIFRGLVAIYLAYLGWKIASGSFEDHAPIPVWAGLLLGGLFVLAAAGFGVYLVRRYRIDLRAAELPEERPEEIEKDSLS